MLPINKKISAYNYFNTNNIQYIVIHDVGAKSTAKNNVDYFSGGNRGASAHYFVDDTSIWQSVEDKHGAWHCGDGGNKYGINNQNSIGIEMCLPSGKVTDKTEQNTLELVKYLMAKYNVSASKVVRHYDASRKNCPAQFNLDGKWTRWNAFKAKLTTNTFNINNYHTTKFAMIKLIKDDYAYKEVALKNKSGAIVKKGTILTVTGIEYSGQYPRFRLKSGLYITTRKDTVEEYKQTVATGYPLRKVGDTVTVKKTATSYQTGQPIASFVKGSKYKIKQIKNVSQSNSKRAYLLDNINSWVLEQDVQ